MQCPACRVQYPLPSEEETAGDERIMSRLRQVRSVLVYNSNQSIKTDKQILY